MADYLSPKCFEVLRSGKRWYNIIIVILVFNESVVALTVAPRYIDLANSNAVCFIAYETCVYLVKQKILQLDTVTASAVK